MIPDLKAAELLDKYKIPQPLSFFEKAGEDEQTQKMTMTKLSRKTGEFTSHDDWLALLADMNSLRTRLFTRLSLEYVQQLYLQSILSSGEFDLARELLYPKRKKTPITLTPAALERLLLDVAKEYVNNAESGRADNLDLENAQKWFVFFFIIPPSTSQQIFTSLQSLLGYPCDFGLQEGGGVDSSCSQTLRPGRLLKSWNSGAANGGPHPPESRGFAAQNA